MDKEEEGVLANWECSLFLKEPGRPFFLRALREGPSSSVSLLGARELIGEVLWLPLGVPEGKVREVDLSYFN